MTIKSSAFTTAAIMLTAVSSAAAAADIDFYENNGCRGRPAFSYRGEVTLREGCKWSTARCRNDVARSVSISNWTKPLSIFVYDAPNGSQSDDWGTVQLRTNPRPQQNNRLCIPSFELDRTYPSFTQVYRSKNGLDGKVSYVFIRY